MDAMTTKEEVRKRDGYKCSDCGKPQPALTIGDDEKIPRRFHVHRIEPDGKYSLENCKTLCPKCHGKYKRQRHKRNPKEVIFTFRADQQFIDDMDFLAKSLVDDAHPRPNRTAALRYAIAQTKRQMMENQQKK